MDYAVEFVNEKKWKAETLYEINQIRNYKQIYLICELNGMKGREQTMCFDDIKERSYFKWR